MSETATATSPATAPPAPAPTAGSGVNITHVIHPFRSPPGSSYDVALRVTCASMARAQEEAAKAGIRVECLGITMTDAADTALPPLRPVPVLTRTINDFATFPKPRPLAIFGDVIAAGAQHGSGTYMIYANIDIGLQPHFYIELMKMIRSHGDQMHPLVITRRTIDPCPYKDPSDLEQIYKEPGKPHPGYDCFCFRRDWVPKMRFGRVGLGAWWFDGIMLANLDAVSPKKTLVYKHQHLTFHLGDDNHWLGPDEWWRYNQAACLDACSEIRASTGAKGFGTWLDYHERKLTEVRPKLRRAIIETRNTLTLKLINLRKGVNYT
jgi:hypothetical protein